MRSPGPVPLVIAARPLALVRRRGAMAGWALAVATRLIVAGPRLAVVGQRPLTARLIAVAARLVVVGARLVAVAARLVVLAGVAGFLAVAWPVGPAAATGQWQWPLDPPHRVTRGFDPPETPYGPGHRGVDLASTPHAAVHAAGVGRVGFAGMLAGRGVVTVLHVGGLKTTYEPVAAAVSAGDRVRRGDLLGRLQAGHPGCPVAACLHWGLRRGEVYLDPLSLVGAGRVRLLPLGAAGSLPSALPAAGSVGAAAGLAAIPALRRRRRSRLERGPGHLMNVRKRCPDT